jgi:glycosyltransferase involved in cell wall biosynthesis
MIRNLTVAVITKQRLELLEKCLESLAAQVDLPDKVIVVDNDICGSARKITARFKSRLPIKYVIEPHLGIPFARNKVLAEAKGRYLGFVDDDCVLANDWVRQGLRAIIANKSAYIIGKTKLANPEKIIAKAQFYHYKQWLRTKIDPITKQLDRLSLDTKNVIFNLMILRKHKLKFDEQFNLSKIGGGEDVDIGMQLYQLGYKGCYAEKMVLKHQELDRLLPYIIKAFKRGRSSYLLVNKWRLSNELVDLNQVSLVRWLMHFWERPYDNQKIKLTSNWSKVLVHVLSKIYDRAWLEGYLSQHRSLELS